MFYEWQLKIYIYFWSKEPQRESDREGQVEEGVRVALLKLVTDGSRPMGEMSDSWGKQKIKKSEVKVV